MTADINGNDVDGLERFQEAVAREPSRADREPTVVARWMGASRSEVSYLDRQPVTLGGEDELNPMQAVLGVLAACDIDLISMHASLLGIEVDELRIEASGHFNVARYLGLEAGHGPGYQRIDYRVHLRAPRASKEDVARLRELCATASPVGDTLSRVVPLTMSFEVETASEVG